MKSSGGTRRADILREVVSTGRKTCDVDRCVYCRGREEKRNVFAPCGRGSKPQQRARGPMNQSEKVMWYMKLNSGCALKNDYRS